MIITVSGHAGSGKSTVAKLLAVRLGFKHYSTGDFMREMAAELGMSIKDLNIAAEQDQSIDKALDDRQKRLGETEDNFVIDSRLGGFFIPKATKVFVDCDIDTRIKRTMLDKRTGEKHPSFESAKKFAVEREGSEEKRYKEFYHFDAYDPTNYDIVIDTTTIPAEEVVTRILGVLREEQLI